MAKQTDHASEMKHRLYVKRNKSFEFSLTAMPVEFRFVSSSKLIEVSRIGDRFIQRATETPVNVQEGWGLDKKALRDVFEKVRTDEHLASFLTLCGPFRLANLPQEITMSEFRICQSFIRSIRRHTTPTVYPSGLTVDQLDRIQYAPEMMWGWASKANGKRPWMVMVVHTALEVIGATLFIDRIEGVGVLKCEWCGDLYDVKSEHASIYCCPQHRQLASQKRRRDAAREAKKVRLESVKQNGKT